MIFIFFMIIGAFLYAIKGGQHVDVSMRKKLDSLDGIIGKFVRLLIDGHNLSALIFGLTFSFPGALGWYLGCKPSLGEQVPAIGGIKGNWVHEGYADRTLLGDESKSARISALKYGLMRGAFMGACLAIPFNDVSLIIAGALWPACVFAGISISQLYQKKVNSGWRTYEIVYGAVLGIGFYIHYAINI